MTNNVTPLPVPALLMPGIQLPGAPPLPAQPPTTTPAPQPPTEQDQLVALIEELLTLVKQGQIRWVAMAGEFDNGSKMSAFGNITKGDPLRVAGSIEWLKAEYMAAFSQHPVTPA